jgi:hypothetical protein
LDEQHRATCGALALPTPGQQQNKSSPGLTSHNSCRPHPKASLHDGCVCPV